MALSTQSVVSDGTLSVLDVSIDYFSRDEIHVFFDDVENARQWAWVGTTDKRITFTPAVTNGSEVRLQRRTNVASTRHIFGGGGGGGAAFTATTVDEDFKQILRIAQEASENIWDGQFRLNLNMHGNRITRLGNATTGTDAVPYGQMVSVTSAYTDSQVASGRAGAIAESKAYTDTEIAAARQYTDTKSAAALAAANAYTDSISLAGSVHTLRTPETIPALPNAAARANKMLAFDASGNPVLTIPASDSAQQLRLDLQTVGLTPQYGFTGAEMQTLVDNAMATVDYTSLRLYQGRAQSARITGVTALARPSPLAGVFTRVSSDTTSVDNGGTIIVDALGRRWKRVYDGAIFAKWFGAVGDGVSNDMAALARVAGYVNILSGGTVDLESGVYAGNSFTCLNFANCTAPVTVRGTGATVFGQISTSLCESIGLVGITVATTSNTFPAFARFENTKRVDVDRCKFPSTTLYVTPTVVPSSVDTCPTDRVSVTNSTFSGDGTNGSGDGARHLYIRSSKVNHVVGNEFSGTSMYEFFKLSEFSGFTVFDRNKLSGSCAEEVLDAFTAYGPIYFTNNTGTLTTGALYSHKSSGASGALLQVAMPVDVVLSGNEFRSASKALVYAGGARGLAWEGERQTLRVEGNILLGGGGGVGSTYSCLDIRGTHVVDVVANQSLGYPSNVSDFVQAFLSVGNGRVTVARNSVPAGSILAALGNTTTGEPYGPTARMDVHNNKLESALSTGAIGVGLSHPLIEVTAFANDITINHAFGVSTRPVYFAGPVGSYNAQNNTTRIAGTSGSITPIFVSGLPAYSSSGNTWDRRIAFGNAAPTVGSWQRGDLIYRTAPSLGTNEGWICVADGTPGTWAPFGCVQLANAYTITNGVTSRGLNVSTATLPQLAAFVGTLIADLQAAGLIRP